MLTRPRRLDLFGLAALTLGLAAGRKDGEGVEQTSNAGDTKS